MQFRGVCPRLHLSWFCCRLIRLVFLVTDRCGESLVAAESHDVVSGWMVMISECLDGYRVAGWC